MDFRVFGAQGDLGAFFKGLSHGAWLPVLLSDFLFFFHANQSPKSALALQGTFTLIFMRNDMAFLALEYNLKHRLDRMKFLDYPIIYGADPNGFILHPKPSKSLFTLIACFSSFLKNQSRGSRIRKSKK